LLDQYWPDPLLEKRDPLLCRRLLRGGGRGLPRLDPAFVRGRQAAALHAADQQAQECGHSTHRTISRFEETRIGGTTGRTATENTASRNSMFHSTHGAAMTPRHGAIGLVPSVAHDVARRERPSWSATCPRSSGADHPTRSARRRLASPWPVSSPIQARRASKLRPLRGAGGTRRV